MLPTLVQNLSDLLHHALEHGTEAALVLHDGRSPLARLLVEGYRSALPGAGFLDVDAHPAGHVLSQVEALRAGSLVVLVQSTRFDLQRHRFRLTLFQRGLKVVEHPHLGRMQEDELGTYVDALAYDPEEIRPLGLALKARLDAAERVSLVSAAGVLSYAGPLEAAKLNLGDYRGARHVGGQFPIGEVITEPVDLAGCSGRVSIHAYGEADFTLCSLPDPFPLVVEGGQVAAAPGAPPGFQAVLDAIRAAEGVVWVRELGFGLNRAFSRTRTVTDVGTYERVCGVHLSLGAKHPIFPKAGIDPRQTRFHVDVFCDLERVEVDSEPVWAAGAYRVP